MFVLIHVAVSTVWTFCLLDCVVYVQQKCKRWALKVEKWVKNWEDGYFLFFQPSIHPFTTPHHHHPPTPIFISFPSASALWFSSPPLAPCQKQKPPFRIQSGSEERERSQSQWDETIAQNQDLVKKSLLLFNSLFVLFCVGSFFFPTILLLFFPPFSSPPPPSDYFLLDKISLHKEGGGGEIWKSGPESVIRRQNDVWFLGRKFPPSLWHQGLALGSDGDRHGNGGSWMAGVRFWS